MFSTSFNLNIPPMYTPPFASEVSLLLFFLSPPQDVNNNDKEIELNRNNLFIVF